DSQKEAVNFAMSLDEPQRRTVQLRLPGGDVANLAAIEQMYAEYQKEKWERGTKAQSALSFRTSAFFQKAALKDYMQIVSLRQRKETDEQNGASDSESKIYFLRGNGPDLHVCLASPTKPQMQIHIG